MPKLGPNRFVLGIAYQAGQNPAIGRGADGARDFFTPEELQKAAWQFSKGNRSVGIFHGPSDTVGHIDIVESFLWPSDEPWVIKATDGTEVVVRKGDWLLGGILDDVAAHLYENDLITGWSPQGVAKRRTFRRSE